MLPGVLSVDDDYQYADGDNRIDRQTVCGLQLLVVYAVTLVLFYAVQLRTAAVPASDIRRDNIHEVTDKVETVLRGQIAPRNCEASSV